MNAMPSPAALREFAACQRSLGERAKAIADATGATAAMHAAESMRRAAEQLDALAAELEPAK